MFNRKAIIMKKGEAKREIYKVWLEWIKTQSRHDPAVGIKYFIYLKKNIPLFLTLKSRVSNLIILTDMLNSG